MTQFEDLEIFPPIPGLSRIFKDCGNPDIKNAFCRIDRPHNTGITTLLFTIQ